MFFKIGGPNPKKKKKNRGTKVAFKPFNYYNFSTKHNYSAPYNNDASTRQKGTKQGKITQ